jgi:FPC/CPF motif-containing protein YcgG
MVAGDLGLFAEQRRSWSSGFSTFIAVFASPSALDEPAFEDGLWRTLQALHEIDDDGWDPSVSSDPDSPTFSFSFGGRAYFVVGLHPASSRKARRFEWPALAFNAHDQFRRLRNQGRFERLQRAIRERDLRLQGSLNPNLANFGELPEARQYSGRRVEEDWACPFHGSQP